MQTNDRRWTWVAMMAAVLLGAPGPEAAAARVEQDFAPIADAMVAAVDDLRTLAALSTAGDARVAATARDRLRAAGPAGLAAFLELHGAALAAASDLSPGTGTSVAHGQLLATLDEICGQKDCAPAQLYWYTDLEQAKAAARASGRPIVSLRLLGDLRDELSCANSRFFRALLYPDPAVARLLRDRFVLHWHSERPAPRITIDLGDGRSIESTITGNSVHYVLDHDGRPVDALPGLLAPTQFIAGLERAAQVARSSAGLEPTARAAALRDYHQRRLAALERAWEDEVRAIGQRPRRTAPSVAAAPRAGEAAALAVGKSAVEVPMLRALGEDVTPVTDEQVWDELAARRLAEVVFAAPSLALLRRQQWRSGDTGQDAAVLAGALERLRVDVARDSVRNEFDLHRTIHRWFVDAGGSLELAALNTRVYSALFLTPRADPWLGLADPGVYTGLTAGGRRTQARL